MFPEYGVSTWIIGRKAGHLFGEEIPDLSTSNDHKVICPCSTSTPSQDLEVFHKLSCIAKENTIMVAANIADKQPCDRSNDPNCPENDFYQFNTEVVFNKTGCLVAKYHKYNLFLSEKLTFDVPRKPQHVFFDTEFGRFGLMVCFDAVFKSPAIDLVTLYNVTDIIFSTAWMNVYPHFVSVGYHSGWARTLKVNYLSANIHFVPGRLVGSGIYSPRGILAYTYQLGSKEGHLAIAKVPIKNKVPETSSIMKSQSTPPRSAFNASENSLQFSNEVFGDKFSFKPLTGNMGNLSLCSGSVCCQVEFERSPAGGEHFALGVFNGMHQLEGKYFLEVCLLVQCVNSTNCGNVRVKQTSTTFQHYKLSGYMNTHYAFPEVLTPTFDFNTTWEFADLGKTKIISDSNATITTVVLMGRNFDKDPKNN